MVFHQIKRFKRFENGFEKSCLIWQFLPDFGWKPFDWKKFSTFSLISGNPVQSYSSEMSFWWLSILYWFEVSILPKILCTPNEIDNSMPDEIDANEIDANQPPKWFLTPLYSFCFVLVDFYRARWESLLWFIKFDVMYSKWYRWVVF